LDDLTPNFLEERFFIGDFLEEALLDPFPEFRSLFFDDLATIFCEWRFAEPFPDFRDLETTLLEKPLFDLLEGRILEEALR